MVEIWGKNHTIMVWTVKCTERITVKDGKSHMTAL